METKVQFKYSETNGIPICPHCQKPTQRSGGTGSTTLTYFHPVYDETGVNINPDRNTTTTQWHCHECQKDYAISGNTHDGYCYRMSN